MVASPAESAAASGEGGIEQIEMHGAAAKALAVLDRGHDDLGRAEQHAVDGVEIAAEAPENLRERSAEIARCATGKRLGQGLRVGGRSGDEELRASAVNDRVVGA